MQNNLAHEPPESQGKVIQFQKKEPKELKEPKMTESFERGFIAKSRLFHNEVEPFLTDAAKNVYSALMGYITGFNKASDHISTRQIQGGKLKGSNKLSSGTVSNGIKELVWFGVITVLEVNYRIGNKYRINEVSLIEAFEQIDAKKIKALRLQNSSASISEALQLVNSSASISGVASASVSEASIDIIYIYLPIDKTIKSLRLKNPLQANFFEFQNFKKTNPDAHIKTFIFEQQKLEAEQKAKAEAERKHMSMLALGSVRVWQDGVYSGDYTAPAGIKIPANVKHTFMSLEPNTIIYCIHNTARTGQVEINQEHHLLEN